MPEYCLESPWRIKPLKTSVEEVVFDENDIDECQLDDE